MIDAIRPPRGFLRVEEGLDTFADVGELEFVGWIREPDREVVVALAGFGDHFEGWQAGVVEFALAEMT
jgi:hypothetical protein